MKKSNKRIKSGLQISAEYQEQNKYQEYVRKYNKKKNYLESKGKEMYRDMLSESQFYETIASYYNDETVRINAVRKKLREEGSKKRVNRKDAIEIMIQKQTYEMSYKQALAALKATKEPGEDITLYDIQQVRLGDFAPVENLKQLSSEMYQKLKAENPTAKTRDLAKIISNMYWGSD